MKLFQRLLVAPAALGLMAPLAANADVTAISNDSDFSSEVIEARVDGVEAQLGEIMAGQFSSSTTMSGKAAFITGYVDDDQDTNTDNIYGTYMYQLNLNTSFTGEDNLYTRIKTGNNVSGSHFVDSGDGTYLSAGNKNSDALKVDKLWYQFPIGDSLQVWVGPKIENYYMLASSASIYRPITKQFANGPNGSAYGSSTSPGFGAAWTQATEDPSDARFALSMGYTAKDGNKSTLGLSNEESRSFLLTKVEYGSPRWQVSAAMAKKNVPATATTAQSNTTNGYDGYYHTAAAKATTGDLTAYGLRAYWKPETTGAIPEVQVGYDFGTFDEASTGEAEDIAGWMVGLGWRDVLVDGNSAGFAYGSRMSATSYKGNSATEDPSEDNKVWEAYYTFKVNDGVSVTPAVFGGSDIGNSATQSYDINGAVLLTEFKF